MFDPIGQLEMPEKLKSFLESLSPEEANQLDDWLDCNDTAFDRMQCVLYRQIEKNPELWASIFIDPIPKESTSIHE